MSIEGFIGKMRRSEAVLHSRQRAATGANADRIYQTIVELRGLRLGAEASVQPSTPGFGCTGQGTLRASHGGTLEPSHRSNR